MTKLHFDSEFFQILFTEIQVFLWLINCVIVDFIV